MKRTSGYLTAAAFAILAAAGACGKDGGGAGGSFGQGACDPNDPANAIPAEKGLLARIFAGDASVSSVAEAVDPARDIGVTEFVEYVYRPTTDQINGYHTPSGHALVDPRDGNLVAENFGVSLTGAVLSPGTSPTNEYQFALLADDGAVLVDRGDGSTIVDNDGMHETRLGCGTVPVVIPAGASIPIRLDYFQRSGEISLVLLWRPLPANPADRTDPLCGFSGPEAFFTRADGEPTQNYRDLLARGWDHVPQSAFQLTPASNRCSP